MATRTEPKEAYVWVWLPRAVDPVVAGVVRPRGDVFTFQYGASYLARPQAVPLYLPELPLVRGAQAPPPGLTVAGCIRDGGPDAWGQRAILARRLGRVDRDSDTADVGLLTYLLESGSDRIGALDFQTSAADYQPREQVATLEELQTAAERVEAGLALSPALAEALLRGTSIGGARPKALIGDGVTRQCIAKFATATDSYPIVKAEAVAMDLARRVGLDVAATELVVVRGKAVLLVDRFDRTPAPDGVQRRMMVSALTLFELDELQARYATYAHLAEIIRRRFTDPQLTLRELFSRIVFNICISNTDDHARNHAAFYTYRESSIDLTLTPAYDLCPQPRSGETAAQAMAIDSAGRRDSRLATCIEAAHEYLLSRREAEAVAEEQISTITDSWDEAADAARLTDLERRHLWRRQILNPAIHYAS